MSPVRDFAIVNATVATLAHPGRQWLVPVTEGDLGIRKDAAIVVRDGRIVAVGTKNDCESAPGHR